jgi:hypothetical protein
MSLADASIVDRCSCAAAAAPPVRYDHAIASRSATRLSEAVETSEINHHHDSPD